MAYYLNGFDLPSEIRERLWQEVLSMETQTIQGLAAGFQNLARHLSLHQQSQATKEILEAVLTLCRPDEREKACELFSVGEQAARLLTFRSEAKDISFLQKLAHSEWILPASALLQILIRISIFSLRTFGHPQRSLVLSFESHEDAQVRHLTIALRGLAQERFAGEQIVTQLQLTDHYGDSFPEWQEILRLLAPYHIHSHWSYPSEGPECCLTMRTTQQEAAALDAG
jgi:hypothetical protein